MPLTVKDILEKTFKRTFKGYDEDEVDKFLDQIIDEYKALQSEIISLKEELAAANEQVGKVKHTEETIMKTLVSAQKTSERIIGEATHKAELMISSAESTAKNRLAQYQRELAEGQNRLDELKTCAQGFASSFASMVNEQAAYFEKTYRNYFGQDFAPLGGINTDALEKLDKDLAESLKDMGMDSDEIKNSGGADDDEPMTQGVGERAEEPVRLDSMEVKQAAQSGEPVRLSPGEDGYMELHEINKALSEIEKGKDFDESAPMDKQSAQGASGDGAYGEYSWLYDAEDQPDATGPVFKDAKEEEEFKSLIDELIE